MCIFIDQHNSYRKYSCHLGEIEHSAHTNKNHLNQLNLYLDMIYGKLYLNGFTLVYFSASIGIKFLILSLAFIIHKLYRWYRSMTNSSFSLMSLFPTLYVHFSFESAYQVVYFVLHIFFYCETYSIIVSVKWWNREMVGEMVTVVNKNRHSFNIIPHVLYRSINWVYHKYLNIMVSRSSAFLCFIWYKVPNSFSGPICG